MTAMKLRAFGVFRQPTRGRSRRAAAAIALAGLAALACNAPISTMRSPYHLRVIEVRNTTDVAHALTIEPTGDRQLGAATTFTGLLQPGETKTLYLYHGFDYRFEILDANGRTGLAETEVKVDRDLMLAYAGDSISVDLMMGLQIELGEPSFADSLMASDPFGVRGRDALMPDTTRGRGTYIDPDARAERERQEDLERQRGRLP